MMSSHFKNRRHQSGQVLITGIIMMSILLLVIIYAFDVHNVIRAKIKVDIAQQSAAMTGAQWQKESLNLMGEINLLKASALLLEGADNWKTPLPDREQNEEAWRREIQGRIDLLTEMQTRISFIGPLMGYAAAQQAAKANGLDRIPGALGTYLELLRNDKRYDEAQGGAPKYINNYDWKEPYISLVSLINSSGVAVYPNARVAGMPTTRPPQLADPRFYTEIMQNAYAIGANDPPKKHYWHLLVSILKSMDDKDFQGKWWDIDYRSNRFPKESEIYTIGVEFGGEYEGDTALRLMNMKPELQIYADSGSLPGDMKWCIYDKWWLPEYYKANYPEYEENHYNYWYGGGVLRKELKAGYIYEGPAAYAEGFADVKGTVNVRPSTRPYQNSIANREAREAIKDKDNPILRKSSRTTTRVGTRRGRSESSNVSTNYRPGSIAKVLGSFSDEISPIAVDMILPVFKKVSPMPTFMPIPYGFQVLKPGYSNLEKFLSWLSEQENLDGTPPAGTEHFLEALRTLVYGVSPRSNGSSAQLKEKDIVPGRFIAGRGLRYYGYNHKFNKGAFEAEFKERLWEWYKVRDSRVFQQKVLDGPGWLQEPALFNGNPAIAAKTMERKEKLGPNEKPKRKNSRVIVDSSGQRWEVYETCYLERESEIYEVNSETHKVAMPNQIGSGTVYRVYVDVSPLSQAYYVIDSKGEIVLNGSPDPTIFYNRYYNGGSCCCEGECKCKSAWNPGKYDGTKGPPRL